MTRPARPDHSSPRPGSDTATGAPAPTSSTQQTGSHADLVEDEQGPDVVDLGRFGPDTAERPAPSRPSGARRLQGHGRRADAAPMAETAPEPAQGPREVGVSFPMTTDAQVQLRDAIRERIQARLDQLRARRSA